MYWLKNGVFTLIIAIFCASCVIEGQHREYPTLKSQTTLLEVGCDAIGKGNESLIYQEVNNQIQSLLNEDPFVFKDITNRFYTLEDPLIMSIPSFENRYEDLKMRNGEGLITKQEYLQEIYELYREIARFDAQKCSKTVLHLREKKDVRIANETVKLCQEVLHNDECTGDESVVKNFSSENKQRFETAYIELCLFNNTNPIDCTKKLGLIRQQNVLLTHIRAQLRDFEVRKQQDFFMTSGAQKFNCVKQNDVTYLSVNLQSSSLSSTDLYQLGQDLSEKWSNDQFKLIVDFNERRNLVNIVTQEGNVSFVKSNELRTIYLSNQLLGRERGNIFAHEFGHVLGFPDCYLEFYERKTKSIVYYELEHENNLMCRVSIESKVMSDYLKQINDKVCVFQ